MAEKENNDRKNGFLSFFKQDVAICLYGILIILVVAYLCICLLSFLFTGDADQSLVENLDLSASEDIKCEVQNWAGYRGACISNFLIVHTFGLSCFFPLYFLMRFGIKVLNKGLDNNSNKYNLKRCFCICMFFLIWLSLTFCFVGLKTSYYDFGGECGRIADSWLEAQIGAIGVFILCVFSLLIFLIYSYDSTLLLLKGEIDPKEKLYDISGFEKFRNLFKGSGINKEKVVSNTVDNQINSETNNSAKGGPLQTEISEDEGESKSEFNNTDSGNDITQIKGTPIEETPSTDTTNEGDNFKVIKPENEESVENVTDEKNEEPVTDNGLNSGEDLVVDYTLSQAEILDKYGPYDPTADLPTYRFPSLNLLKDHEEENTSVDNDDLVEKKNQIIQAFKNFGIEVTAPTATVGPTVTLYEIVPAPGVKISRIKSLEQDIAMSLSALCVRMIAPIPGKGTIGIEVPNKNPQIVSMKSILNSKAFQETKAELPVAFGKTITNNVFVIDLAKTPHLLVAGSTGQGKSVGLNALITSLLYKIHPSRLKFVMIDPKQVEFSIYSKIERQYLAKLPGQEDPIITEPKEVINTLNSLTREMEDRYFLLKEAGLKNIVEYNQKFISRTLSPTKDLGRDLCHHFLPYIVVIIDEYGDLIMTAGKEIEVPIARIAQKARAVGIHMVIATQRPQVKIITGMIKANFPARLAFRVMGPIDSRTILEENGAQHLVGKGDMLYKSGGIGMTRVQCAYIDTDEVTEISKYISEQPGYPTAFRLPEFEDEEGNVVGAETFDTNNLDPKIREAAELVVSTMQGSTSSLQRTMSIGFNRAGRLMDQLESIGVVGKSYNGKPREVLVHDLEELETILSNIGK